MKRHHALEPFSRDHYGGLVVARNLKEKPGPESLAELKEAWQLEMEDHFREEEVTLSPLAPAEMAARLLREHQAIRELVERAEKNSLSEAEQVHLGHLMHDHIRWEERELFPIIQQDPRIETIEPVAQAMEQRRHQSALQGRREELVTRREKARDGG